MGRPLEPVVARFVAFTEAMPSGCVEFNGQRSVYGYGSFWLNGRNHPAHRAAWMIFVGDIPAERVVHHMCRNRACVNPMHLSLLTLAENSSERRSCHCGTCKRCRHADYMRAYLQQPERVIWNRKRVSEYQRRLYAAQKKESA